MSKWYKIVHIPTLRTIVEWPTYFDDTMMRDMKILKSHVKYEKEPVVELFHIIMFKTKLAANKYIKYFNCYNIDSFVEESKYFMTLDEGNERDIKLKNSYNIKEFMIVEAEDV